MRSEKHFTPLKKRILTDYDENIRMSEILHSVSKRPRLNTIHSQQDHIREKLVLTRSATKRVISPIKCYESKLNISSDAWSVHSFSEKKYKRGWRPTKQVDFGCFFRIILLRLWYDLKQKFPVIQKIWVRINRYVLNSQQKKKALPVSELLKLKQLEMKQPSAYKLAQNTFIQLKDLMAANLYQGREQINDYAIAFLGLLLDDINKGIIPNTQSFYHYKQPLEKQINPSRLNEVVILIVSSLNNYLKDNNFLKSSVSSKCEFETSPEEMACIYQDFLESYPQYLKTVSKKELEITTKYQMGYRFYEQRKIKFVQDWVNPQNHILLRYRGKNNYGVITYNKKTQNIIVLSNCKFAMQDADLGKIQKFLGTMGKPNVVNKGSLFKLPILKLTE